MELAPEYVNAYRRCAHWLRHLLERLGREPALAVWRQAFEPHDDELLATILTTGWRPAERQRDVEKEKTSILAEFFAVPVETVTQAEARQALDGAWPLRQIGERFTSLDVRRDTSTYEALHLSLGGIARLVETLIAGHGKQGELIAYDALLYWSARNRPPDAVPIEDFLAQFARRSEEPSRFTCGLDYTLVRASDTEVVLHIRECEWARYYHERHPAVGYLLACSLDEADYRAVNPRIRMQRTTTLMEGGALCDFRIYAIAD
jgi:hypothetical protein